MSRLFAAATALLLAATLLNPRVASAQAAPIFQLHTPPAGAALTAGEPTLDATASGHIVFQAGLNTYRINFKGPAGTTVWTDVTNPLNNLTTLDPFLTADAQTGRIFVSQLATATSLMAFSDNEGQTWTASQGAGIGSGIDHQSVASGPYPKASLATTLARPLLDYPHAVYYCSQTLVEAFCARSDNGGLTFGLAIPLFKTACSGGLHGHVKVAPDGTVYVPHKNCGGKPGVAVSEDAGLTWAVRTVPAGTAGNEADPSIGIGKDGTAYLAWVDANGHPKVARTLDKGLTWTPAVDLGGVAGVNNAVFPVAVSGDGDRAAVAYLGTSVAGNHQDLSFPGKWYLYIATSYDRGVRWSIRNLTPDDPVQGPGGLCTAGVTCGENRNLLDFMDIAIDRSGRLYVGFADGCTGACVNGGPNSFSALGTIARQVDGALLLR